MPLASGGSVKNSLRIEYLLDREGRVGYHRGNFVREGLAIGLML